MGKRIRKKKKRLGKVNGEEPGSSGMTRRAAKREKEGFLRTKKAVKVAPYRFGKNRKKRPGFDEKKNRKFLRGVAQRVWGRTKRRRHSKRPKQQFVDYDKK